MKTAIVFVLDASSSMGQPASTDGNASDTCTRLESAKRSIKERLAQLMLQYSGSTLLVGINVVPTIETMHHKNFLKEEFPESNNDDPTNELDFANITELVPGGVGKPTIQLLQSLESVQVAPIYVTGSILNATFLAADALHERTYGKNKRPLAYERSIVMYTDAAVPPNVGLPLSLSKMLVVVDALREMNCRLQVVGIDFGSSATFDEPLPADQSQHVKQETAHENEPVKLSFKKEITYNSDAEYDYAEPSQLSHNDQEESDDIVIYHDKEDVENLLKSLTEKTGGEVIAVNTLQQVIEQAKGKKLLVSTKRKLEFRITPNLVIPCRYILLVKKETATRLKTGVIVSSADEHSLVKNESNLIISNPVDVEAIHTIVKYVDEDDADEIIEPDNITKAIRYGSTLIPMSSFDFSGLVLREVYEQPTLEILAYTKRTQIPQAYLVGPPYAIIGEPASHRATTAIAALATALEKLDKVAICNFCKSKEGQPILGALFPFSTDNAFQGQQSESNTCLTPSRTLTLLQLPYRDDVKKFDFDDDWSKLLGSGTVADTQADVADQLVDSLMLPSNVLNSGQVPSPFVRSWNQTLIARSLDHDAKPVTVRSNTESDPLQTPPEIAANAKRILDTFYDTFPVKTTPIATKSATFGKKGRQKLTFKDALNEEQNK